MSRLGASSEPESRHGFSSCSFSCPSFCLALKVPVRDEMFGAERRARVHAARSEAPLRQQRPPMTSPRPCLARSRRRVDCVLLLFPTRSQRVSSCRLSLPPSLPSFFMRSPCFSPLLPFLPHSDFPSLSPFRRCSFRPCPSSFSSMSVFPCVFLPCTYCCPPTVVPFSLAVTHYPCVSSSRISHHPSPFFPFPLPLLSSVAPLPSFHRIVFPLFFPPLLAPSLPFLPFFLVCLSFHPFSQRLVSPFPSSFPPFFPYSGPLLSSAASLPSSHPLLFPFSFPRSFVPSLSFLSFFRACLPLRLTSPHLFQSLLFLCHALPSYVRR